MCSVPWAQLRASTGQLWAAACARTHPFSRTHLCTASPSASLTHALTRSHSRVGTQQDVTTFLAWAASPEHDERKLVGIKALTILAFMIAFAMYQKKLKWAPLKSRKVRCAIFVWALGGGQGGWGRHG